ncbi:MAG: hypothetical protein COX41_03430 [Candidatus Omnitrophica bacterium CG23_combo_of_CG06-09_8_20_14_all_41_10]|uniref:Uncharacterized protein n=1 Tax=Candidatus Sherwoodlollariibacterium unditelluris TaxID=1974757 RepID=A0A2G9YJD5_9BACT|nr:MAG: hypothetical protein COX41_03430 [Candidatus Omnitrophica bacterium CG23_combo_of_CG06-09_8_20_14_all_41_10]
MVSERIETIRKKFHREWLLIAVDKIDKKKTIPLTGKLLFHSPYIDEVDKKSMKYRGEALLIFSEDRFPEGMAAAF